MINPMLSRSWLTNAVVSVSGRQVGHMSFGRSYTRPSGAGIKGQRRMVYRCEPRASYALSRSGPFLALHYPTRAGDRYESGHGDTRVNPVLRALL